MSGGMCMLQFWTLVVPLFCRAHKFRAHSFAHVHSLRSSALAHHVRRAAKICARSYKIQRRQIYVLAPRSMRLGWNSVALIFHRGQRIRTAGEIEDLLHWLEILLPIDQIRLQRAILILDGGNGCVKSGSRNKVMTARLRCARDHKPWKLRMFISKGIVLVDRGCPHNHPRHPRICAQVWRRELGRKCYSFRQENRHVCHMMLKSVVSTCVK